MVRGEARTKQDEDQLEKHRALYGLLAVVVSNVAISGVAVFGVWRLHGDSAVIVGILTAAFTAVSTMTTAYLSIKAVSNTAKTIALGDTARRAPVSVSVEASTAPAQRSGPPGE